MALFGGLCLVPKLSIYMMTRNKIFKLALATLIGFSLVGWLIITFILDIPNKALFDGKMSLTIQLGSGFAYGIITALLGWELVKIKYLRTTLLFFVDLIQPLKLSFVEIVLISICAGVGEELFFRGAIQPLIGIWITAIIFVALHGYLNPKNLKLSLYGIFMTFIIVGMGYLAKELGLLAAMMAHTMVDIVLIYKLSHFKHHPKEVIDEIPSEL